MNKKIRETQIKILQILSDNKSYDLIYLSQLLNEEPSSVYRAICALNEGQTIIYKTHKANGSTSFALIDSKNIRCSVPSLAKTKLELDKNEYLIELVLYADTHIGWDRIKEHKDNAYLLNEYCYKHDINNCINLGDAVFESNSCHNSYNMNQYELLELLNEIYPLNPDIKTFLSPGNHDVTFAKELRSQLNLLKEIQNLRYDIHSFNEKGGKIQLGNNQILLRHKMTKSQKTHYSNTNDFKVIASAHSHLYSSEMINNSLVLSVPAYSTIHYKRPHPAFITLELYYENNEIYFATVTEVEKVHHKLEEQFTTNFDYRQKIIRPKKAIS